MAQNLKEGIGRELRYVEYKLRKRKAEKERKKKSSQAALSAPTPSISDEFRDSVPSNRGEEDLQLQVALAMSRENAKEKSHSEMSDKHHLELVMKESAEVAARVVAKSSPTKSAPVSQPTSLDPWGVPAAADKQQTFDPFRSDKKLASVNSFETDAWSSSATQFLIQDGTDAWGGTASSTSLPAPHARSPVRKIDPWGPSQSTTHSDPWNVGASSTTPNAVDPWSSNSSSSTQAAGSNLFNQSHPQLQGISFDPFVAQENLDKSFSPAQNFDPLQDFDKLSFQASPNQKPLPGANMFSMDIMTPQSATADMSVFDTNGNQTPVTNANTVAGSFLGKNAALVNMDHLASRSPQVHQYITLNTSTTGALGSSRNPFNPKGPSLTLNQMKGGATGGFGMQTSTAVTPVPPNMMPQMQVMTPQTIMTTSFGMQATAMSMQAVSMPGGRAMQPVYGMSAMVPSNPFSQQQAPNVPSISKQDEELLM